MSSNLNVNNHQENHHQKNNHLNNHQENNHLNNNHQENIHQNSQQELNHCLIDNKNDDCQIDCNIDNNVINNDDNISNNVKQMNKVERIREYINQCISDKSKKKISNIINNVIELTDIEKALLYLNLPTGSSSQENENLKINKPGNPFGKKADSEVSQTFIWIKTHLEEDQNVSLPKHEVYDEYKLFCESNQSQPVCQADFGKLMKHLFPNVKPRRLGQRGNSRYCYSGLRKKTNFDRPELPDVFVLKDRNDNLLNNKINKTTNLDQQLSLHISNDKNLIQSASSYVVLEWARKFFDHKLTSIKDLAKHLINLNHIDKKSMAALTLIASDDDDLTNDNEFQNLHNNLTLNQTNQFDDNNLMKAKKKSDDLKIVTSKHKTDNLTFKRTVDTQKKDKQMKKKLDKEYMKSNSLNKINKSIDIDGKLSKSMKIKNKRIKKENLINDKLNSTILDNDKSTELDTKIKLESFGNLTNKLSFNNNDKLSLKNPIEINKTKNREENQFINNTQQFKSTSNFDQLNLKRRHSTTGFHYSNQKQFDNQQIVDDLNYKYQLKRQTSEHFDSTNKKSNLEQSTNLNLQSTNYLTNELNSAKATNQLISYKKYSNINNKLNIINNDNSANLIQQQQNGNQNDSLNTNNVLNQTISTQVNEQELYQLNNNLFNNNQLVNSQSVNNLNQNDIFVAKPNLINNYNNETVASGMCNVNTQMPSIPPSPINQIKDPFSANQFQQTTNQIINDKLVDFNNNLSTSNIQQNYSTSNYTEEQIQVNNCQHLNNNNNNNNQKMFLNPSNQQTLLNKNSINNRPLNRARHSSGPSYMYSSMLYNSNNPTNNFLSNSNLINVRSNSLSPLYENCSLDNNHKMINFNNVSNFQQQYSLNNNSMKFTFASNPTSPVSEPISPNVIANKKMTNLRFSKFNNLEQTTKKDSTRSASFAGSSEPFISFARTRQRHMSSPYILLPNINSNNDFSNSTQSLTTSFTNSNSTTFNSNNDVFIQQSNNLNMIDDHNSNNLNNQCAVNQTNLQDNYISLINSNNNNNKPNYEYPLSPPLTSNIIGEEKSFNNHHLSIDLQNNNSIISSSNFNQSIPEFQNNNINDNFNISNLMNADSNISNIRPLNEQSQIDHLQETLEDLKEICDKDL